MKILHLLFLLTLLSGHVVQSQSTVSNDPFSQKGEWLYTDSGLTLASMTRANALLVITWSPEDPSIEDLTTALKKLRSTYSWLSIVGVIQAERPYQISADHINSIASKNNWDFPLFIPSAFKSIQIDHWSYALYGQNAELISSSSAFNMPISIEESVMQYAGTLQKRSAKLNTSYIYQDHRKLEDLNLFLNASDIEVDPSYEYLFIADTDHHRIVMTDLDGAIIKVIGTGLAGSADGPVNEASFNRPSSLAYDSANRKLYIAERGNGKIRVVNIDNESVTTLNFSLGKKSKPPVNVPISDLSLENGKLMVASPEHPFFIEIDISSEQAALVFGTESKGYEIQKNPLKTQLISATAHVRENQTDYFFDQARGIIYKTDKLKSNVLLTEDSLLSKEYKALYDEKIHHLTAPVFHEGKLVAWNTGTEKLIELDPYSYTINDLPIKGAPSMLKRVSGIRSVKGKLYIIDGFTGRVFTYSNGNLDPIQITRKERLLHQPSSDDLVLHLEDVHVSTTGQTQIKLLPLIPTHFSLDSQSQSYIFLLSNDPAAVLADGNLRQQEVLLTLFPDLASNQVNLMAELNFCEKSEPTHCYQRTILLNIPIMKGGDVNTNQELDLELFKGL